MKELSIEEKAKRYDEILARAKGRNIPYYKEDIMSKVKEFVDYLIPELAESEDEQMIKSFTRLVKAFYDVNFPTPEGFTREEMLAWLEKQGEHANFRNKIQIGDKVTRNEDGVLVNLSQLNRVAKKDEKRGEQKSAIYHKFRVGDEIKTQKEESLTITKIDKEGYWSEDLFICDFNEECIWDLVEQKPAEWSEEDETTKNNISHIIRQYDKISKRENQPCYYVGDCLLWMQNIKDRVQPQPKSKWKPTEEQITVINDTIRFIEDKSDSLSSDYLYNKMKELLGQLNAL